MHSSQTSRLFTIALLLSILNWAVPRSTVSYQPDDPTPDNTVIVAAAVDARFSQDFSTLLRQLRLPWVILENDQLPAAVRNNHVILIARPDSPFSGTILRQLLSEDELDIIIESPDRATFFEKDSPWAPGRRLIICAGADMLQMRNASELALREMIAAAPQSSSWIQTRFDDPINDKLRSEVGRLRYTWEDEELPLSELLIDAGARPRRTISSEQAAADVARLFYLLSHGYAGYAFFNQQREFAIAEARIQNELETRSRWSTDEFSTLLAEELSFITDCHMKIGEVQFARHADFWFDTTLEVSLENDGYSFTREGVSYTLLSVNRLDPEPFLFPSLNADGKAIYRLGTLDKDTPEPLLLLARDGDQEQEVEIRLSRSDFDHYANDIFREDRLGGIPVLRVRSFADFRAEDLNQFVNTGREYREEPVVVIDLRGNGGGNESWPIGWIQGLTGRRANAVFVSSELHSKTSMAGRANLFVYLSEEYPENGLFGADARRYSGVASAIESGTREPRWTEPAYPAVPLIANDTTLIIVTNNFVASAGEGLVLRASQAENVVLVGENTMGCLTFGNISTHQLPHSRLPIQLPINFGLFLDGHIYEEIGITPDLWVPAADAVNYSVAAVRAGTISTQQPLSQEVLRHTFKPEDPWARTRLEKISAAAFIVFFAAAGLVWAYFNRKRPRLLISFGAIWLAAGCVFHFREQPIAYGFLFVGATCLLWGLRDLLRMGRASTENAG